MSHTDASPDICALLTAAATRLRFRPLAAADFPELKRQFQDPDMCAFHGEAFTDQYAVDMIASCATITPQAGYLRVAITDAGSGEWLGTIGFHFYEPDSQRAEVGYDIWKEHWNQGYASEALAALCAVLPTVIPLRELYLLTPQDHSASIAVAGHNDFSPCAPIRDQITPTTAWFHREFSA